MKKLIKELLEVLFLAIGLTIFVAFCLIDDEIGKKYYSLEHKAPDFEAIAIARMKGQMLIWQMKLIDDGLKYKREIQKQTREEDAKEPTEIRVYVEGVK